MSGIEALYWAQQYPDEVEAIIGLDMAVPEYYEEMKINIPVMKLGQYAAALGVTRWIPGISESDAIKYGTLTDNEKEELNISTSDDKNILSKKKFEILLKKSSNIFLSYKIKSPFKEYVKSFVIDELNIKDNIYNKDYHITYSSLVDKLFLADVYDKTYKEENEENILALYSNYQIDYKSYSNKFKPFSSSKIKDFIIKNQIKLSYSSISNYFLCNFKYYLENLLKIKVNDKTIATDIGSIYHSLLEKSYKNDFNYENEFNNQIKDISDNKTLFYLNKYKDLMTDVVDLIHKKGENSELK